MALSVYRECVCVRVCNAVGPGVAAVSVPAKISDLNPLCHLCGSATVARSFGIDPSDEASPMTGIISLPGHTRVFTPTDDRRGGDGFRGEVPREYAEFD